MNSAHDNGTSSFPDYTTLGVSLLGVHEQSECFASYFEQKVKKITESTIIDHQVYSGKRKLFAGCEMFMSTQEVDKCIRSIKLKNSEGYDRIPQRILVDGANYLLPPPSKVIQYDL